MFQGVWLFYCSAVHVLKCHFLEMFWRRNCFWNKEAWGEIDSALTWNTIEGFLSPLSSKANCLQPFRKKVFQLLGGVWVEKNVLFCHFPFLVTFILKNWCVCLPPSLLPELQCSGKREEEACSLYLKDTGWNEKRKSRKWWEIKGCKESSAVSRRAKDSAMFGLGTLAHCTMSRERPVSEESSSAALLPSRWGSETTSNTKERKGNLLNSTFPPRYVETSFYLCPRFPS